MTERAAPAFRRHSSNCFRRLGVPPLLPDRFPICSSDDAYPRRGVAQGHETRRTISGVDERANRACPGQLRDPLRRTEQAIERCRCPSQPSWRWFRPGAEWFHRRLDDGSRRLIAGVGSNLPLGHPAATLWFMACSSGSMPTPVGNPGCCTTPQSFSGHATPWIFAESFSRTSAARGYGLVTDCTSCSRRLGPTIRASAKGNALFSSLLDRISAVEGAKPQAPRAADPELQGVSPRSRGGGPAGPSSNPATP